MNDSFAVSKRQTTGCLRHKVHGLLNRQRTVLLYEIRKVAGEPLGALGPAAGREACVQLKNIIRRPWVPPLVATKEEMENGAKWADLQRAAKAAIGKIGCD